MTPHCCESHRRFVEQMEHDDDTIDWRSRKVSALLALMFLVGVVLLAGIAGGMDVQQMAQGT